MPQSDREKRRVTRDQGPIRVYLDHKDYANITKGLRGDPNHQEDVRHYETLRKLVGEGRVICYFSHVHVVEAIRSSGDDWLQAYSRVVDSLTHGHCMVFTGELHRRELQHFVGEVFGLPVQLSTPELAFGRGFEAFLDPEPELARWLDESTKMNKAMSETLQERAVNRKQRRQFAAMGERLFSKFVVPTDIDMSNMPPPVADLFRQPGFAAGTLTGSREHRKKRLRQLLDRATTFSSILPYYRSLYPDLAQIGIVFDDGARCILDAIERHRATHQVLSELGHEVDFAGLRQTMIESVARDLAQGSHQTAVNPAELERALVARELRGLPWWEAALLLYMRYLSSNIGESRRTPQASDSRDIFHISHAPYLNYLVTDRYFASTIATALSPRFPDSVVLRRVGDLCSRLGAR